VKTWDTGFEHVYTLWLTRLTLDLVASPASGVLGARREFLGTTDVAGHLSEPVGAEQVGELAVGESLGDVAASGVSMRSYSG
jgi:hypothetical protein